MVQLFANRNWLRERLEKKPRRPPRGRSERLRYSRRVAFLLPDAHAHVHAKDNPTSRRLGARTPIASSSLVSKPPRFTK